MHWTNLWWACLYELTLIYVLIFIVLHYVVDGQLLFDQLPLLQIDGHDIEQTNAILRYIVERAKMIPNNTKDKIRYIFLW